MLNRLKVQGVSQGNTELAEEQEQLITRCAWLGSRQQQQQPQHSAEWGLGDGRRDR